VSIIFEFDKYSIIGSHNVETPKGVYQWTLIEGIGSKYTFEVREFNRTNVIKFCFEQAVNYDQTSEGLGFMNFHDVFLMGCTGFGLEKIFPEQKRLASGSFTSLK
jgi:hypothetical protein